MTHYSKCSPDHLQVDLEEGEEDTWPEVHGIVLQTMMKYLYHLEEGQVPVIRYARVEKDDLGLVGFGDWSHTFGELGRLPNRI